MSCGNPLAGETEEGEPEQTIMPRKRQLPVVDRGICQRCKNEKGKHICRRMTYCPACYQLAVHLRINRQLYPPLRLPTSSATVDQTHRALHRPFKQPGNVLIALSGGVGSTALLDICLDRGFIGLKGEERRFVNLKKGEKDVVWEKGWVVWVDFSGVITREEGERERERGEVMRGYVEGEGLEWVAVKVEDVFDETLEAKFARLGDEQSVGDNKKCGQAYSVDLKVPGLPISSILSTSQTPLEKLQSLLSSVPNHSRPALLSSMLSQLLTQTARFLPNISHLLLGETSTRQAQRIISGTALGRGWTLPLELKSSVPLPTEANGSGEILRILPMKDVSVKEAAILCHIRGLKSWNWREWDRLGGKGKTVIGKGSGSLSIESLTEKFIAGLDVSHPATVSTINKTGDKLVFAGGDETKESLCPLCQMPVDESAEKWKSRTALTSLNDKSSTVEAVIEEVTHDPNINHEQGNHIGKLGPLLCYACLTTLTISKARRKDDVVKSTPLPLWVGRRAVERSDIAEFLLVEGDGDES